MGVAFLRLKHFEEAISISEARTAPALVVFWEVFEGVEGLGGLGLGVFGVFLLRGLVGI